MNLNSRLKGTLRFLILSAPMPGYLFTGNSILRLLASSSSSLVIAFSSSSNFCAHVGGLYSTVTPGYQLLTTLRSVFLKPVYFFGSWDRFLKWEPELLGGNMFTEFERSSVLDDDLATYCLERVDGNLSGAADFYLQWQSQGFRGLVKHSLPWPAV